MNLINEITSYIDYLRKTHPVAGVGRVPLEVFATLPLYAYLSIRMAARAAGRNAGDSRDIIRGATDILGHSLFSDRNLLGPGTGAVSGDGVPGNKRIWKEGESSDFWVDPAVHMDREVNNRVQLYRQRKIGKNVGLVSPFTAQQTIDDLRHVLGDLDPEIDLGLIESGVWYPYYVWASRQANSDVAAIIDVYSSMIAEAAAKLASGGNFRFQIGIEWDYGRGWMVQVPEVLRFTNSFLIAVSDDILGRHVSGETAGERLFGKAFSEEYPFDAWYVAGSATHVVRVPRDEEKQLKLVFLAITKSVFDRETPIIPLEIAIIYQKIHKADDIREFCHDCRFSIPYRKRVSKVGIGRAAASLLEDEDLMAILSLPEIVQLDRKALAAVVYLHDEDLEMGDAALRHVLEGARDIESGIEGLHAWEIHLGQ